jgi:4-hydroxybenzoate polyprenyltransferase
MDDQEFKFDSETLYAQRATRKMVKRDTWILILALFGSFILLFILDNWFPSIGILFLPLLIVFYVANNWRQWAALIENQLRCPHCGELLAEGVNLLFSPSAVCRHCKKVALASTKQLEQQID